MDPLTPRQRDVLDYVRDSTAERGFPPTLREIGRHLGIRSTNGVSSHLSALTRKGYLTREPTSRAIRLHDLARESSSLPLVAYPALATAQCDPSS